MNPHIALTYTCQSQLLKLDIVNIYAQFFISYIQCIWKVFAAIHFFIVCLRACECAVVLTVPSMLWGTCTKHVIHITPYKIRPQENFSTSSPPVQFGLIVPAYTLWSRTSSPRSLIRGAWFVRLQAGCRVRTH